MYTPEDRLKHVWCVRTTLYQHQIRLLCIPWLPVEIAGQSRATRLPCDARALEANAGHMPAVRPALQQQAVTMLFLQLCLLKMVTYVQNKLIKFTIIVDISILGFNAHCMRPTHYQNAVQSPFVLKTHCAFATSLLRFSQSGLKMLFFFFCASFMCDWDKFRSMKTQRS